MELRRRSPFRIGLVNAQDLELCQVRVTFPDLDQVSSYWLPVAMPKAQNDKVYWVPDVGEQVVCLMDDHDEAGCVLGAIYSSVDLPPVTSADKFHLAFKDGAALEYDRAAHALSVSLPSGATLSIGASGASIEIDAQGNVTVSAAGTINLGSSGKAVARLGDQVTCPAGTGTITSASAEVFAQ